MVAHNDRNLRSKKYQNQIDNNFFISSNLVLNEVRLINEKLKLKYETKNKNYSNETLN